MGQGLGNLGERKERDTGQGAGLTPPASSCLFREESTLNPGQGPPGLGDPGSLFLEGQDQQHGEKGSSWWPVGDSCMAFVEGVQVSALIFPPSPRPRHRL